MVVLHGGPGFDQGYLRPGLAPLSRHAQLFYVDLRGQGRSGPAAPTTCTLEQMADDITRLCATLGLDSPLVFGHSAGGFVALHLARRHPQLPGGLLLCDTAPTLAALPDDAPPPGLADRAPASALLAASRLFGGDFSDAAMTDFKQEVLPHYAAPGHEQVAGEIMALSTVHGDVAGYFFTDLAPHYDLRDRLADINTPTHIVVGDHDWVCPPVASRLMAAEIPGAMLTILPAAGHFPFSEAPEPFLAAVREFINEHVNRRAGVK